MNANAPTAAAETGAKDEFRLLHTMLRVLDLEKSLAFYTGHLGMKLLRRADFEGGRFSLAFVGYGDESAHSVLELTHNWDQKEPYEIGTAYGHIALGVSDIFGTCEKLAADGVAIPRPPGAMQHGSTVIAFIQDPDGYKIELIQSRAG